MVFSSPVNGCYYGLLNVIDPSIAYDSNGKIISVLRLPPAEDAEDSHRDPYEIQHDATDDIRAGEEPMSEERTPEPLPKQAPVSEPVPAPQQAPVSEHVSESVSKQAPVSEQASVPKEAPATELPVPAPAHSFLGFFTVPSLGYESAASPPKVETETVRSAPPKVETVRSDSTNGEFESPELEEEYPVPMFVSGPEYRAESEQQREAVEEPEPALAPEPEPQSMVLVADYMEATPLFKTILRKNWHAVLYFLRTGSFSFSPLLGSVDMAGVEQQVQTWVAKKDTYGTEMWRQLPLHAAICYGAPTNVVEKLIEAYPGALQSPDSHGNLPLHLAFIFNAEDSVAASLMKAFPASLHVINAEGLQPIQCSNEICSQTFQSKAELFGALSDYTRAVAENDPDRLEEQLQDVHRQLKAVNDTLFATAPPRKPEAIKEYLKESNTSLENSTAMVSYGPSAFLAEIATGLCPMSSGYDDQEESATRDFVSEEAATEDVVAPQEPLPVEEPEPAPEPVPVVPLVAATAAAATVVAAPTPRAPPKPQGCRVMEFNPRTKSWREI